MGLSGSRAALCREDDSGWDAVEGEVVMVRIISALLATIVGLLVSYWVGSAWMFIIPFLLTFILVETSLELRILYRKRNVVLTKLNYQKDPSFSRYM